MTQLATIEQLTQLKLAGMLQAYREQIQQPPTQDLSFDERFSFIVDRELLHRSNRRLQNLLRRAKLRLQACMENIDYEHPRNLNKSQFISLANGDFIRHHHNVLITGPTGSGKSYLACAIGNQACRQGLSVRYLRVPRFLDELTLTHADGSHTKCLNQLIKIDLLILDDFALSPLTPLQRQDLFNLIEDRHQLKSVLVTSQLPTKHWHEYIGEPTLADAILDRLLENARRLELKGNSMRKTEILDCS